MKAIFNKGSISSESQRQESTSLLLCKQLDKFHLQLLLYNKESSEMHRHASPSTRDRRKLDDAGVGTAPKLGGKEITPPLPTELRLDQAGITFSFKYLPERQLQRERERVNQSLVHSPVGWSKLGSWDSIRVPMWDPHAVAQAPRSSFATFPRHMRRELDRDWNRCSYGMPVSQEAI